MPAPAAVISKPTLLSNQTRLAQEAASRSAPHPIPSFSPNVLRRDRTDIAPTPIRKTGSIVRSPISVEPIPVETRIRFVSGPIAAMAGRKLSETARTANMRKVFCALRRPVIDRPRVQSRRLCDRQSCETGDLGISLSSLIDPCSMLPCRP